MKNHKFKVGDRVILVDVIKLKEPLKSKFLHTAVVILVDPEQRLIHVKFEDYNNNSILYAERFQPI